MSNPSIKQMLNAHFHLRGMRKNNFGPREVMDLHEQTVAGLVDAILQGDISTAEDVSARLRLLQALVDGRGATIPEELPAHLERLADDVRRIFVRCPVVLDPDDAHDWVAP